ncbi:hypothetical protein J6590_001575 [Homalodisca vitripennis]|nr:hypothetical protein J6590_001575 [Homalodisca vitripennis]
MTAPVHPSVLAYVSYDYTMYKVDILYNQIIACLHQLGGPDTQLSDKIERIGAAVNDIYKLSSPLYVQFVMSIFKESFLELVGPLGCPIDIILHRRNTNVSNHAFSGKWGSLRLRPGCDDKSYTPRRTVVRGRD